uniref:Uncharacterized protein n=1 Tax=Acrobeloides nanus TaxID=290746 RepID=A0A914CN93_9BILA
MEKEKNRPLEFYIKVNKDTPLEIALTYLEEIRSKWQELDSKVKELVGKLDNFKFDTNLHHEDILKEDLDEFYNRIPYAYEFLDEHQERNIPIAHRVILESRLMVIIVEIIEKIESILVNFKNIRKTEDQLQAKCKEISDEARDYSEKIQQIHLCFLQSFLNQKW